MGTTHNDTPPASAIEPEQNLDRFSALCSLTSFVTNSKSVLKINWKLTPTEVSVLCSLIASGISVSQFALQSELPPDTANSLGSAIKYIGTIHTISLSSRNECEEGNQAPELLRALSAAASSALEQLSINFLCITSKWLTNNSFSQFTALRSLTIKTREVCPIPLLATRIGQLRTLESLHIALLQHSDSDADVLFVALKGLPLLADLSICCSGLGEKAGRPIGSLVALGRLRKLVLDYNRLGNEGISTMVDEILSSSSRKNSCVLQQLGLVWASIGPTGGIKLAELIAHSPHLRVLNLSKNNMNETAANALFKAIRLRAQSLEELNASDCELGPRGALPLLLDASRAFPALRTLDVGRNEEGDLGAHALAQFLLVGCRLAELQIQYQGITETGALELAGALAKVYTLRSIFMRGSPLGPRGAVAIFDALSEASTMPMNTIDFAACEIGDDGASAAGRLILHRGCRNVHLSRNEIQATGAKAIVDSAAISPTCVINLLNLSRNPIGDEGVKRVLDKIMQSRRRLVHKLDIGCIQIGVKGAMAIKLAVETYGVPFWMRVTKPDSDAEAGKILDEVVNWERDSKSSWAAILELSE